MLDEDRTTAHWQPNAPPEVVVPRIRILPVALWILGLAALALFFAVMLVKIFGLMFGTA